MFILLQQSINDYNIELKELKDELESMKNVIAHTFEDELKTTNSVYAASTSKIGKRWSNFILKKNHCEIDIR